MCYKAFPQLPDRFRILCQSRWLVLASTQDTLEQLTVLEYGILTPVKTCDPAKFEPEVTIL